MAKDKNKVQKGSISIDAQNIMPVIKRWLYSDKDIFLREIVSNGVDAITKLRMVGGAPEGEELRVVVTLDKKKKEIRVSDNGIGMTAEEVDAYINQVAFSSAEEFLKNYTGEDPAGIIGHFGLGFYSAFMAADRVTIDSLSYKEGASPVQWTSEDGITFEMGEGTRTERGTTITMRLMKDEEEFLKGHVVEGILNKYCGYMSVPINFEDIEGIKQQEEEQKKRKKEAEKKRKEAEKKAAEEGKEPETLPEFEEEAPGPVLINEVNPLWLKAPKDCTEEEYKETYRKLFNTWEDPLFWIHLNVDYPFTLKGILYFPRIKRDFSGQDGQVKLFNRQVFVADNIKEVIPEFLLILKGVIDCPDLPLNVSRSFLQNDGYVRRISNHIAKKVADRLTGLYNTERKTYEGYWDDIHPFIKYGCIRDRKFFDAVKDALLMKTTADEYLTFDEYKSRNEGKTEKKVYYTTDANRQAASVALYTARGIDVVVMDTLIDVNFMSFIEYSGVEATFVRVDSDVSGLTETSDEGKDLDADTLQTMFREALDMKELDVRLEALADRDLPAMVTQEEQMRRFKDMSVAYGREFSMPDRYTLVLNRLSPVVQSLAHMKEGDLSNLLCRQIYDLARLSSRPLEADDLKAFIARSNKVLSEMVGHGE